MVETSSSVDRQEVEQFASHAGDWWDPRGSEAMLHRLNPVRLAYIRDWIDQHWQCDEHDRRPLEGRKALDVGCGAGLLAEPLARLGAEVTAIDPAAELIDAALEHAAGQGLAIDYRGAAVEEVAGEFDLVTAMEVIEHTADPEQFVHSLGRRLAQNGLMFLSTPNPTAWSKLVTITLGEGLGLVPRGTHEFDKFIGPERMRALLDSAGLKCLDVEGIAWTPTQGLHLSDDLSLNYLVAVTKAV